MNYPEFREEIFKYVKAHVPADVFAEQVQVEKINSNIRYGITFHKKGEKYAPTIYLEPFYDGFRKGKSVEALGEELLCCYLEEEVPLPDCIRLLDSYETAKQEIYVKLIHTEENRHLLEEVPHRFFLDFAIVPYFEVNSEQIFKGSVLLKKAQLEFWQVSEKMLMDYAMAHTLEKKGILFMAISSIVEGILPEKDESHNEFKDEIFVLSNKEKFFGAVNICFPEVLYEIGTRVKEDYYMLPSSVHEWIIVPVSQASEEESMREMVRSINAAELLPEEVLSQEIYYYNLSSQKVHTCYERKDKN